MARHWAAIDIGSNTVQLLVAESVGNHFRPHLSALRTTRLGHCPEPGRLARDRVEDTLAVLAEYRDMLARHDVEQVRVIATSAVRDAVNRDDLLTAARERTGWRVEVLSGEEEAYLSFVGAAAPAIAAGAKDILLIDIGGSSSELIRWREGCLQPQSLNVGAVRACRWGWDAEEIERRVCAALAGASGPEPSLVIGVGGTITAAAGLMLCCPAYLRAEIEGYLLTLESVEWLLEVLNPLSLPERCAFSPLLKERGEIIVEGLLILRAFCRLLRLPGLRVSGGGVLDGCLLDLKLNGRISDD